MKHFVGMTDGRSKYVRQQIEDLLVGIHPEQVQKLKDKFWRLALQIEPEEWWRKKNAFLCEAIDRFPETPFIQQNPITGTRRKALLFPHFWDEIILDLIRDVRGITICQKWLGTGKKRQAHENKT